MFYYEWRSDVKFLTVGRVRNLVNILDSVKRGDHLFVLRNPQVVEVRMFVRVQRWMMFPDNKFEAVVVRQTVPDYGVWLSSR